MERAIRSCVGTLIEAASRLGHPRALLGRMSDRGGSLVRDALGRILGRISRERHASSESDEVPRSPDVSQSFETELEARRARALPRMVGQPRLHGTVWLPRLLWGLAWAEQHERSPVTAAELAEIVTQHGGVGVAGPNVARAFRELRRRPDIARLWDEPSPLRYRISVEGQRALLELLGA